MLVHKSQYPRLFEALQTIAMDSGSSRVVQNDTINAPDGYDFGKIEHALAGLLAVELDEFAIGEHEMQQEIAARSTDLGHANELFIDFFDHYL